MEILIRSIFFIDLVIITHLTYNRKLEDLSPSTHNMDVPNVVRNEYSLINIDDGFLSLMLNDGSTKDDVKLPEGELGEKLQEEFDEGKELLVSVVSAMGEEHALSCKCERKFFAVIKFFSSVPI
jgi:translation initiation factor 5A